MSSTGSPVDPDGWRLDFTIRFAYVTRRNGLGDLSSRFLEQISSGSFVSLLEGELSSMGFEAPPMEPGEPTVTTVEEVIEEDGDDGSQPGGDEDDEDTDEDLQGSDEDLEGSGSEEGSDGSLEDDAVFFESFVPVVTFKLIFADLNISSIQDLKAGEQFCDFYRSVSCLDCPSANACLNSGL